ncbi:three-helix bundle dimerization domain-containing protein [Mycolicibacterium fortuitum]|jgi:hypothetical protein|uniref:three-helix bundle dimerization domain-containing protein n=1 Tax=Mycolicibacterium fortuitum TaxID=1766 RepID=UPI0039B0715B|nr:hypothetical protein H8Z57_21615 [Mycolicibacterium fortuitum]
MRDVSEQTVLAEITDRLVREFSGAMPADVDAAVRHAHGRFDASPIRDFIPLFVEKQVRRDFAERRLVSSS